MSSPLSKTLSLALAIQTLFVISLNFLILPSWFYPLLGLSLSLNLLKVHLPTRSGHVFLVAPILAIAALNLAPAGSFGGGSSWLNQILCTYFALSFLFRFSVENWQRLCLLQLLNLCFCLIGWSSDAFFLLVTLDVLILVICLFLLEENRLNVATNHKQLFGSIIRVFLQTVPLVFLLFFLLPRLVDPNQRRFNRGNAYTGISERLAPGEIRNVAEKWDLVFEAYFKHGALPQKSERYWRVLSLSKGDGLIWEGAEGIFKEKRAKVGELSHEGYLQQITLDLSLSTNLPALDQPVSYPRPLREPLASPSLLKEDDSGSGRIFQYELTSAKFGNNSAPQEPPVLQEAVGVSSRLRGLVNEWSKHARTPEAFMNLVGKYLKSEQFIYTLSPGLIHSLDSFFFEKKRGFCGHYAAASASILRAAGYPSRVIVGFHGGEKGQNPENIAVYARDAHAWVEVWSSDKNQWLRFDPTSWIAPDRLKYGGQRYFSPFETGFLSTYLSQSFKDNLWALYRAAVLRLEALTIRVNRSISNLKTLIFRIASQLTPHLELVLRGLLAVIFSSIVFLAGKRYLSRKSRLLRLWHQYLQIIFRNDKLVGEAQKFAYDRIKTLEILQKKLDDDEYELNRKFIHEWLYLMYGPGGERSDWVKLGLMLKEIRTKAQHHG